MELSILGQGMDTVSLRLTASQNKVETHLSYFNDSKKNNRGALNADVLFLEKGDAQQAHIAFSIQPSHFMVNEVKWELDPTVVLLAQKEIHFSELKLHNHDQTLTVEGTLSKEHADTLRLSMNRFDVSLANLFLKNTPYQFSGVCTGQAQVIDFYQNRQFSMNLSGTNLYANDQEMGSLDVVCLWNHQSQRFQIGAQNVLQGKTPLNLSGFYYPNNKYLTVNATLQNLSATYFEPFLHSLISDLNGTVSGNLSLNGTIPNLSLTANRVDVNDVGFTVNFTKVPYLLNGPISLHENGFSAQNVSISDRYGNKGTLTGGMRYRYFRNAAIDANVVFSNLQMLSTKESDNTVFYGDVFATGRMLTSGALNDIKLDIFAKTERNTSLHIPLSQMAEAKQNSLLSFTAPPIIVQKPFIDPLDNGRSVQSTRNSPSKFAVNLKTEVTTDTELLIEFNKASGNVIRGFGSGNITIGFDQAKSLFDIFGEYNISNGDYQFILQGIPSRKFHINPGGKVTFNGNLLNTHLDLTAAYHTKASINTLLANSNSVANLRDVACQILMTGNMLNPNLGFNIEVADLAPEIRSRVQAAFSPEDKLVRQFMALLVTGSFIPDQQSGIVYNTSSILYSNATEILSNQLNNIFDQLKIPLDVGFNYQPSNSGRDIYDVAISTQLFNNRVVVNGNLGNKQTPGSTGDIAGNVDIEFKITNNGNLRANVFSRAADQYSNYIDLDNTQRNGVGMIYQGEFDTFRELFNRIFGRKKKTK
jgi:hypothetical protein